MLYLTNSYEFQANDAILSLNTNTEPRGRTQNLESVHSTETQHFREFYLMLKSKWKDETSYFAARNGFRISKQSSKKKNNPIIFSFYGFYYRIVVT